MGLNLDQNNDVYLLGYSYSKDIPTPAIDYPVQNSSYDTKYSDAIFFKIHGDGTTLDYATYLGGDTSDYDPIGQKGIKFANCRIYLAITPAGIHQVLLLQGYLVITSPALSGLPFYKQTVL